MAANGADTPSAKGTTPTNRVIAAMFADQLEGAADMPTPSDLFQSECRGNTSPARSADASNKRGISPRKTSSPASKKPARSPLRSALVYAANTAAIIINAVIPPSNDNIAPPLGRAPRRSISQLSHCGCIQRTDQPGGFYQNPQTTRFC